MTGAGDHFIGPFHRLHGNDRLMLDRDCLANIQAGDRVRHPVAELEVLLFCLRRRPTREHACTCEERLQQSGRIYQLDTPLPEHVRHRADQAVGISDVRRSSFRNVRSGIIPPAKILLCLTCPPSPACVTPACSRRSMHLPSCPREIQ